MKDTKPLIDVRARKGGYQEPIEYALGEKIRKSAIIPPRKPKIQIIVMATGLELTVDIIKPFK